MTDGEFRFGVNLLSSADREQWRAKCARAEELGYDVILVPDHLGMPAPFPSLVAAADATGTPRLGTFVLNAAFYNPTLLARDVAGTHTLTGQRLELGLGTGYVREEFDAAGLEYGTGGRRVDHLEATVTRLRELLDKEGVSVPLLLGGNGDRMLRLAAEYADTIGFTGAYADNDGKLHLLAPDAVGERVEFARAAVGARGVEWNVLVQKVALDSDGSELRAYDPSLSDVDFAGLPTVLFGSASEIADKVRAHRRTYGFTYFTVLEDSMENFAKVLPMLR